MFENFFGKNKNNEEQPPAEGIKMEEAEEIESVGGVIDGGVIESEELPVEEIEIKDVKEENNDQKVA